MYRNENVVRFGEVIIMICYTGESALVSYIKKYIGRVLTVRGRVGTLPNKDSTVW